MSVDARDPGIAEAGVFGVVLEGKVQHGAKAGKHLRIRPGLGQAGLFGLEAYYKHYEPELVARLAALAAEHGLFALGGSDFHGIDREDEREMAPLCLDAGVAMTPWSPLARGFLAGNRKRGGGGATARAETDGKAEEMYFSDTDFAIADRAVTIAKARDVKPIQVALAWLLAKPGVTSPVVGVTKKEQLGELAGALDLELTDEEMAALEAPYLPKRPYR